MNRTILFSLFLLFSNTDVLALPTAKVTLKVVNENGQPVEAATAGLTFYTGTGGRGPATTGDKGLTDGEGLFTGSGSSPQDIDYGVAKAGYYTTGGKTSMESYSGIIGFRRWKPWNQTLEVVLKKKINPIALYAIKLNSRFSKHLPTLPVLDRFIGYDLIARDWVVPYGQGTHRDFLFKLEKHRVVSVLDNHVTLTLKFSNEGDGIQSYYSQPNVGSSLRLPHNAPTTGYESELVIDKNRTNTKVVSSYYREDQNYFFRVRTEKDEKGNIVSALYGKIYGAIELGLFIGDINPTGSALINYYLNPTPNDTNLEFDTRKNLFTDLTSQEEVTRP